MKIGDIIQWIGSRESPKKNGKIGLIIDKEANFFKILWEDGKINSNIERQMRVISESR